MPPSGPMDALAFRLANRLVGNAEGAAALEMTVAGPTLRFNCDSVIALAGADMGAELDGVAARQLGGACGEGRLDAEARRDQGHRLPRLSRGARRLRRAGLSRQQVHLHPRPVRRPCRAHAAGRRCAASSPDRRTSDKHRATALPAAADSRLRPTPGKSACSTARTARRISSPTPTSRRSSPPTGKCITTPAAPASG